MKIMRTGAVLRVEATGFYHEEFTDRYTYSVDTEPPMSDCAFSKWRKDVVKSILADINRMFGKGFYYNIRILYEYTLDGKEYTFDITVGEEVIA